MRRVALIAMAILIGIGVYATLSRLHVTSARIMSVPSTHIYYLSGESKTFTLDFLVNTNQTFFTEHDAVMSVEIESEDATLPLNFEGLETVGTLHANHESMYHMRLHASQDFVTDQYRFEALEATMNIHYKNNQTAALPVGEFVMHHFENSKGPLRMESMHNVHGRFDYGLTSKGYMVSLYNDSQTPITLNQFETGSQSVPVNDGLVNVSARPYEPYMPIESLVHGYEPTLSDAPMRQLILDPGESKQFVVPFAYRDKVTLLHRYPLTIAYQQGETAHTYKMEDFAFINSDMFVKENMPLLVPGVIHD